MTGKVRLRCESAPQLLILSTPPVQFVDGVAEVDGELLPQLVAYQAAHGVVVDGPVVEAETGEVGVVEADVEAEPAKAAPRSRSKSTRPFG